ncbi:MAG TPA: DUF3040 domain-containing protein [Actinomycetota bacterium]|nr:DUF3040 domain-containing protein [Actinomycetota bacterium]
MPLSDHEQRILDEIEKSLYQEDPAFARGAKEREGSHDPKKRARMGAACLVAGFLGLLVFFYSRLVIVGVVAFAAMVLGVVLIAGAVRISTPADGLTKGPADRLGRFFSDWEDRVRQRYKKD